MPPSFIPSLSDHEPESDNKYYLENLLESARPFLRGQFEHVHERLPALIAAIRANGAGECWHKDNIFIDHLVHIYRILKLWKLQESVCLCGLFHNSYPIFDGILTIFEPTISRATVRDLVGEIAEKMIFLYCGVPHHKLFNGDGDLLSQYSDAEFVEHLELSKLSLQNYNANNGKSDHEEEAWRKKIQSVVPATGLTFIHMITGEDLHVSRRAIASLLVMIIADFADQFTNFLDVLFNNLDGNMNFLGNDSRATWPGDCKPGLWMTSMSRIGALFTLVKCEEELFLLENEKNGNVVDFDDRDQHLKLITPPVFENCSKILYPDDQVKARELYWEAVCFNNSGADSEKAEELLLKCIELNPFVGEPHVVLGQIYISQEKFSEGEKEAEKGLKLLLEWGTAWDKRMGWENWVSWTRVLLFKAKGKSWPTSPLDVLMLGPISYW